METKDEYMMYLNREEEWKQKIRDMKRHLRESYPKQILLAVEDSNEEWAKELVQQMLYYKRDIQALECVFGEVD